MNSTIGKLATRAGVNVETVRYYERTGLIEQPVKPANGFRRYDKAILDRILFIKKAQTLGFKLDEVKTLLELSVGNCVEIQSLAEVKLEDVQLKIRDLQQLESVLADLVKQCRARVDKADCPIVEVLLPDHKR
jgi:MerR family transcriptional regulator, mercuric resistance operon regulatory protein